MKEKEENVERIKQTRNCGEGKEGRTKIIRTYVAHLYIDLSSRTSWERHVYPADEIFDWRLFKDSRDDV